MKPAKSGKDYLKGPSMNNPPEDQAHRHELGKLIAELRDFRAGIFTVMGYTSCGPG